MGWGILCIPIYVSEMAENWERCYEVERAPTYYVPVEPPKQRRWVKWVVMGILAVPIGGGVIYGVVENNRIAQEREEQAAAEAERQQVESERQLAEAEAERQRVFAGTQRLSPKGWDGCTHDSGTEICAVGWRTYRDDGFSYTGSPDAGHLFYGIWF